MDFDDFMDMLTSHRRRNYTDPRAFAGSLMIFACLSFFIAMNMPPGFRWIFVIAGIGILISFGVVMRKIMTLRLFAKIMIGVAIWMFFIAWLLWSWISLLLILLGGLAVAAAVWIFINNRPNNRRGRGGYGW